MYREAYEALWLVQKAGFGVGVGVRGVHDAKYSNSKIFTKLEFTNSIAGIKVFTNQRYSNSDFVNTLESELASELE
uniref:Uncharacterized protein n=1 Tax=Ditylenchus dipsaci TaxID=166011 RepID=A0A915EQU0_9BILA